MSEIRSDARLIENVPGFATLPPDDDGTVSLDPEYVRFRNSIAAHPVGPWTIQQVFMDPHTKGTTHDAALFSQIAYATNQLEKLEKEDSPDARKKIASINSWLSSNELEKERLFEKVRFYTRKEIGEDEDLPMDYTEFAQTPEGEQTFGMARGPFSVTPYIEVKPLKLTREDIEKVEANRVTGNTYYAANERTLLDNLELSLYPNYLSVRNVRHMLRNIDPDAQVGYIVAGDPESGIAVKSPRTGNVILPFLPERGLEKLGVDATKFAARDVPGMAVAYAMWAGKRGKRLLEWIEGPSGKKSSKWKSKPKELAAEAGIDALAIVGTRAAIMATGAKAGLTNVTFEEVARDALYEGAWAAAGAAGSRVVLDMLAGVWGWATGQRIPQEVLDRVEKAYRKYQKPEPLQAEFSTKDINEALQRAGAGLQKQYRTYNPTLGEGTQDEYIKQLEIDLYRQLRLSDAGTAAFEAHMKAEDAQLKALWDSLAPEGYVPHKDGPIDFDTFKAAVIERREQAKEQAEKSLEDVRDLGDAEQEKAALEAFGEEIEPGYEAVSKVAEPLMEIVPTAGATPHFRNLYSPVVVAERDARWTELDSAFNAAVAAIDGSYRTKSPKNVRYIKGPFQKWLDGGKGTLIRSSDAAKAGETVRQMTPMVSYVDPKTGELAPISVIQQLLGVAMDPKTGRFLKQPNITLSELIEMRKAVFDTWKNDPNPKTREFAGELAGGIELQIEDLLRNLAEQEMRKSPDFAGIETLTKDAVSRWMRATGFTKEFDEAQQALESYGTEMSRKWLREIATQATQDPRGVGQFLLNQSPKNVRDFFQELARQGMPLEEINQIRRLALGSIKKKLTASHNETGGSIDKGWQEYFKENQDVLVEMFPGETLRNIKKWENVSSQVENATRAAEEALKQAEKELAEPIENFVAQFMQADRGAIAQGNLKSIETARRLLDQYPMLRSYVTDLFQYQLRREFAGDQPVGQGTPLAMGLDAQALNRWLSEGYGGEVKATEQLGRNLDILLGKGVGMQYAKDLRVFNLMLQRATKAGRKSKSALDLPAGKAFEDTEMSVATFVKRIIFSPLNPFSRRITVMTEGMHDTAASHLLEILVDPRKLEIFLRHRDRLATGKRIGAYLGALATADTGEIGSERDVSEERFLSVQPWLKQAEEMAENLMAEEAP